MNSLDLKDDKGPFDIIGDVHGCYDELCELIIDKLGYRIVTLNSLGSEEVYDYHLYHPEDRKLIFVGDLTDRGPKSPLVLHAIMRSFGRPAYCVVGNHDDKLKRYLQGRNVQIRDGLQKTIDQLETYYKIANSGFFNKETLIKFLNSLPSHLILDEGRLAVTHGALKEEYFGLDTPEVKAYCMYGAPMKVSSPPTFSEVKHSVDGMVVDSWTGAIRHHPWAEEYKGDTLIVHGHIVVDDVKWVNNTVDIDTGCVFGGKLTAFRYPEREIVQVQAKRNYHNG